ncbi:MAG TPA: protein-disulfide reductase DsbD domain-containing protein [Pirellulales bacterium]|nr:protein-disulfide reductase DsbD domain-containing protein [Pirellulales bacterium]
MVTSRDQPVAAAIDTDARELRPGGQFMVSVRVQIRPGWYIYAVDKPAGMVSPTSIQLELSDGIEQAGDWILPAPSPQAGMPGETLPQRLNFVYDGAIQFECPLRVAADAAPGEKTIRCLIKYQACDRFSCRPPSETILETAVRIER